MAGQIVYGCAGVCENRYDNPARQLCCGKYEERSDTCKDQGGLKHLLQLLRIAAAVIVADDG